MTRTRRRGHPEPCNAHRTRPDAMSRETAAPALPGGTSGRRPGEPDSYGQPRRAGRLHVGALGEGGGRLAYLLRLAVAQCVQGALPSQETIRSAEPLAYTSSGER